MLPLSIRLCGDGLRDQTVSFTLVTWKFAESSVGVDLKALWSDIFECVAPVP